MAQALALQPDVCFFDIRMPGCTGLEAAQALAEDWPDGPAAPPFPLLVFVTAYDEYARAGLRGPGGGLPRQARGPRAAGRLRAAGCRRAWPTASLPAPRRRTAPPPLQATLAQLRALLGRRRRPPAAPRLAVIQAQVGNLVHLVPVDEVSTSRPPTSTCAWSPPSAST